MIRSDASSLLKINAAKKWSRLEEEPGVIENSGRGVLSREICVFCGQSTTSSVAQRDSKAISAFSWAVPVSTRWSVTSSP